MAKKLYVRILPQMEDQTGGQLRLIKEYSNADSCRNMSIKDLIYDAAKPNENYSAAENRASEWVHELLETNISNTEACGIKESGEEMTLNLTDKLSKYENDIVKIRSQNNNNFKEVTFTISDTDPGGISYLVNTMYKK